MGKDCIELERGLYKEVDTAVTLLYNQYTLSKFLERDPSSDRDAKPSRFHEPTFSYLKELDPVLSNSSPESQGTLHHIAKSAHRYDISMEVRFSSYPPFTNFSCSISFALSEKYAIPLGRCGIPVS